MQKRAAYYWNLFHNRINLCTPRERVLLLITGVFLIIKLMFNFFITPYSTQRSTMEDDLIYLEQQYHGTETELTILQDKLKMKVSTHQSKEFSMLQNLLEKNKNDLFKVHSLLIDPKKIPNLLESMVKDFSGLKLMHLETLAEEPVNFQQSPNATIELPLYRQAIKMKLVGEYQDLLSYLKKVESLPYPLGWEEMNYSVVNFPKAQIELTFYTLRVRHD